MDWMETNHSKIVNWNGILKMAIAYTDHVPIEVLRIKQSSSSRRLVLRAPHKATDNFVGEMAKPIKGTIDPNLDVYVDILMKYGTVALVKHSMQKTKG